MNNNIGKAFWLTSIIIITLIAMYWLPEISVNGTLLRRINILADVEKEKYGNDLTTESEDTLSDLTTIMADTTISTPTSPTANKSRVIPQKPDEIVDPYDSITGRHEMDHFYEALSYSMERNVRIGYFGDSFIEGDILTQDLRDMLQERFGGNGVGFVDIASNIAGFRRSVQLYSKGWNDFNANDAKSKNFISRLQGINGRYFIPEETAYVDLRGQKRIYAERLDTMDVATMFYTPGDSLKMSIGINGSTPMLYNNIAVRGDDYIDTVKITGEIGRIRVNINKGEYSRFYGIALDGKNGISLDNFNMRGSTGTLIGNIPERCFRQFAKLRPYDLIILHFGLNVASEKVKNYSYYTDHFIQTIRYIQSIYPETSILVIGVGDRASKDANGNLHTMKGVKELLGYQKKMAEEAGVGFWNMYEALGGEGCIERMLEKELVNLDYTHANYQGGRYIAEFIFNALIKGKERYDGMTENASIGN